MRGSIEAQIRLDMSAGNGSSKGAPTRGSLKASGGSKEPKETGKQHRSRLQQPTQGVTGAKETTSDGTSDSNAESRGSRGNHDKPWRTGAKKAKPLSGEHAPSNTGGLLNSVNGGGDKLGLSDLKQTPRATGTPRSEPRIDGMDAESAVSSYQNPISKVENQPPLTEEEEEEEKTSSAIITGYIDPSEDMGALPASSVSSSLAGSEGSDADATMAVVDGALVWLPARNNVEQVQPKTVPANARPPRLPKSSSPSSSSPGSFSRSASVSGVAAVVAKEAEAKQEFGRELVPDEIHQELEESQVYALWEQLAISHVYRLKFRQEISALWDSGDDIAESVDDEADQLEPLLPLMGAELDLVRRREESLWRLQTASAQQQPVVAAGGVEADVAELTEKVSSRLEAWVRRHRRPFLFGGVDYLDWMQARPAVPIRL